MPHLSLVLPVTNERIDPRGDRDMLHDRLALALNTVPLEARDEDDRLRLRMGIEQESRAFHSPYVPLR